MQSWMKCAAALDSRLVIWWMDGVRYGVVEQRSQPMYGMKVGIFQRYFPVSDGLWKIAMFELTYYTDLNTGELLENWDNFYTGETNTVRHVRLGPEIRIQNNEGQAADPDDRVMQQMLQDYRTTLGPPTVLGNEFWLPTSVEARLVFPGSKGTELVLNHYTTINGNVSDAMDPALVSAPCSIAFQNILRWEPWMQMGKHPGHMMSRAAGRKLESLEDLPADYRRMAETVHPKLIRDPLKTLEETVARIQGS